MHSQHIPPLGCPVDSTIRASLTRIQQAEVYFFSRSPFFLLSEAGRCPSHTPGAATPTLPMVVSVLTANMPPLFAEYAVSDYGVPMKDLGMRDYGGGSIRAP